MINAILVSDTFQINLHVHLQKYLNDCRKVNYSFIPPKIIKFKRKDRENGLSAFYNKAVQRSFPIEKSNFQTCI